MERDVDLEKAMLSIFVRENNEHEEYCTFCDNFHYPLISCSPKMTDILKLDDAIKLIEEKYKKLSEKSSPLK